MNKKNIEPRLIRASLADYPLIQNLARFYVYDLSRFCGFISPDWECPADGLFESFDFKSYFLEPSRAAYVVRVRAEPAGFVLVKKGQHSYQVSEFFIIAKFQRHGVGAQIARQLWSTHAGEWELSVIPENISGLGFWRKVIAEFSSNKFSCERTRVDYDAHQPYRYVFSFRS